MEKGIQYLRELAVLEMIYNEHPPIDPDEVRCTQSMWRKFLRSASPLYASSLAVIWREDKGQTVEEIAAQLWQYEESLSSSLQACFSALEELSQNFQQFKEDMSHLLPARAHRSRHPFVQEREYRGYIPQDAPWFYSQGQGENMSKWDRPPTPAPRARVQELWGETLERSNSAWKNAAPVSTEQLSRQDRRVDFNSDPLKGLIAFSHKK
ncbi:uncharacterized protein LOC133625466 [Colius striatus]|uniref:uncharacterized protein LOC133625466 n=1 Tax=Colius striatus TaxID=57412 RepID=UPI002B1E770F|nr:uncharacterized protein LOC133625466 [Colius striatus]